MIACSTPEVSDEPRTIAVPVCHPDGSDSPPTREAISRVEGVPSGEVLAVIHDRGVQHFKMGYDGTYTGAGPVLEHVGLPATFFVRAGLVDSAQPFPHDASSPYRSSTLTGTQVEGLAARGVESGSHGLSHANLGHVVRISAGEASDTWALRTLEGIDLQAIGESWTGWGVLAAGSAERGTQPAFTSGRRSR
jgi:hypothetical protein